MVFRGFSSADICPGDENIEMIGFTVHQAFRGKNLSALLLSWMGRRMRAPFYAINTVSARAGTLTNICGGFASMNVWYRTLER